MIDAKTNVQAILWTHRKDRNGLYPVFIKITGNGGRKYIATGIAVAKDYWDTRNGCIKSGDSGHPEADRLNKDLRAKKDAFTMQIGKIILDGTDATAKQLKQKLTAKALSGNVFDFIDSLLNDKDYNLGEGTMGMYKRYRNKLEKFNGSKELTFNEIDKEYLTLYLAHLRETLGRNTIQHLWNILTSWFIAAQDAEIITLVPGLTENPKGEIVDKAYLTVEELDTLEALADDPARPMKLRIAAGGFLLGCYTGLRVSDWARVDVYSPGINGSLRMRAHKNKKNVSIPMYPRLKNHLARLKEMPKEDYDKFMRYWVTLQNRLIQDVAKKAGITKHLSSHCGRKTFAVTICRGNKIDLKTCAQLMGISVETCNTHYYSVTDESMKKEVMEKLETM